MDSRFQESADAVRASVTAGNLNPSQFRATLEQVPGPLRDVWLDRILGIEHLADDGPHLPRGCSPYLPCSVDAVLKIVDGARVMPDDVFVDIGSGVGRAALLVRFLTGASVIGIEVQPALVDESRNLARRLNVTGFSVVEGDATALAGYIVMGSVFFLYCPFSGSRLHAVLDGIEPIAETRPLRVCSVDLTLPARPWLSPIALSHPGITVCESTISCYYTTSALKLAARHRSSLPEQ